MEESEVGRNFSKNSNWSLGISIEGVSKLKVTDILLFLGTDYTEKRRERRIIIREIPCNYNCSRNALHATKLFLEYGFSYSLPNIIQFFLGYSFSKYKYVFLILLPLPDTASSHSVATRAGG